MPRRRFNPLMEWVNTPLHKERGEKMPNLDRFAVGLADPQEFEPKTICKCHNDKCSESIIFGYEAFVWDGEYFCSKDCFAEFMGLEEVEWQ